MICCEFISAILLFITITLNKVNWAIMIIIIISMSEMLKDFWFICYCHYDIATSLRLALDKKNYSSHET